MKNKYVILLCLNFSRSIFSFWKACWCICCDFSSVFACHFLVGCWLIYWIFGSIHCVHSLVTKSPWTNLGSINQDRYHLYLIFHTLSQFSSNLAYSNLCDYVSPRVHDQKLDRSIKINTTYALVKNSIFASNWLYSYGLIDEGHFHNLKFKIFEKVKIPKNTFPSFIFLIALRHSFQRRKPFFSTHPLWSSPLVRSFRPLSPKNIIVNGRLLVVPLFQ